MRTFSRCGHPLTPDNTTGVVNPSCKTCRRAADARLRARRRAERQAGNLQDLIALPGEYVTERALVRLDPSLAAMPRASKLLLEAICREHPNVFQSAKRVEPEA